MPRKGRDEFALTIFGPSGIRQSLNELSRVLYSDIPSFHNVEKAFNVVIYELKDGEVFKNELFELTAIGVIHGENLSNAYIYKKESVSLGYSGDSSYCDAIIKNIPNADNWIIEANKLEEAPGWHMGLDQVKQLAVQHKNQNFYVVHRADYETNADGLTNIFFPNDNDEIVLKN